MIAIGTPVRVYWHWPKSLYSVQVKSRNSKGKMTWRVAGHFTFLVLQDATFHVGESGRQKVLREKKKNVHAKIHGIVTTIDSMDSFKGLVHYNPYMTNKFLVTYNNHTSSIEKANVVSLASIMGGSRVAVMG
jgi:hypothetical protein